MKAITIWQPWASLIACGAKPYEFRMHRNVSGQVGKRVAIHAGARKMNKREVAVLIHRITTPGWRTTGLTPALARPLLDVATWHPERIPLAAIVCTAVLGEPVQDDDLAMGLGLPGIADSERLEHSNWGWPLTEIELLEPPVPAHGAQGWWTWNPTRD